VGVAVIANQKAIRLDSIIQAYYFRAYEYS
jgi:hypothetical protein